jgi:hypothetical protein
MTTKLEFRRRKSARPLHRLSTGHDHARPISNRVPIVIVCRRPGPPKRPAQLRQRR